MRPENDSEGKTRAHRRCAGLLFSLAATVAFSPLCVCALTLRTKSDLRFWETVSNRSQDLSWPWEPGADAAEVTFSNRLTRAVSSETVGRMPGAMYGGCSHPVPPGTDEALVVATLEQTSNGVAVACWTAELAYVSGAAGRPLTVRTKARRDWRNVECPRLSAFDARWWNMAGPSGYDVLWSEPPGLHRVVRAFEGAGVVDEAVLRFGVIGLLMTLR